MGYLVSVCGLDMAKAIQLRVYLVEVVSTLQHKFHTIYLDEAKHGDRVLFSIGHRKGKGLGADKELRRMLGQAMAEYICHCEEPEMIRKILKKDHSHYDAEEMKEIEEVVNRLLEGSAWEYARVVYVNRRGKLAKQISQYLKDHSEIALDGFTQFRLMSYKDALSGCVKEAVDEFIVDQQYREFIMLLRSFVTIQTPNIYLLHVLHRDNNHFEVYKEDGTKLKAREIDGVFKEVLEQSFSHEDTIVSMLLTALPEKVILHTRDPEENLVRTLVQVFQGRLEICEQCHACIDVRHNSHGDG